MTDFRELCAELEKECFSLYAEMSAKHDFNESYEERMDALRDRARAALNTPPLTPIPVSERLPGAEDCHPGDDWCWAIGSFGMWMQIKRHKVTTTGWKAWLPHWAIPLPGESQ